MSGESKTVQFSVGLSSKSLVAIPSSSLDDSAVEKSSFLVGTLGFQQDNQLLLVSLDEEDQKAQCIVYKHPKEIRSIAVNGTDPHLVTTIYTDIATTGSGTDQTIQEKTKIACWKLDSVSVSSPKENGSIRDLQEIWGDIVPSTDHDHGMLKHAAWKNSKSIGIAAENAIILAEIEKASNIAITMNVLSYIMHHSSYIYIILRGTRGSLLGFRTGESQILHLPN